MKLPKLCKNVIVIDNDFLIKAIEKNYDFYSKLYPDKTLNDIKVVDVLKVVAFTTGIHKDDNNVSVVFLFRMGNSRLPHTVDVKDVFVFNNFTSRQFYCTIDECDFSFASFFADPEIRRKKEYHKELGELIERVALNDNSSNISVVIDDIYQEETFQYIDKSPFISNKKFVIYRSTETEMYLPNPPKFWNVNLDYIIADKMGISDDEI